MDAKPTVLLGARVPDAFVRRLAERFELLGPLPAPFPETVAALPAADAARVRAVITMGTVNTSRDALLRLPAVGLVSCIGSGYEGVDLAAARERGIAVTHSPGANASAVADLALGLLIASVRQMPEANAFLRRGDWKGNFASRMNLVRGLTGRRVGIYGLGAIGEKIARRVAAFEMEVAYHNRKPRADVDYPHHATLAALASWADVLIVAVRAGAGNRHAVNAQVLAALGPQGHVVNIARGSVIDEAALIHALRTGTIAGAGLDVFEHEPAVPEELLALTNVALTPHIAGGTLEAQAAMQDMVIANLDAFFAGNPVVTPVPELATLPAGNGRVPGTEERSCD
jgi:lactate dehydrogenase-like 2-hydroxyacid dehydrogenase